MGQLVRLQFPAIALVLFRFLPRLESDQLPRPHDADILQLCAKELQASLTRCREEVSSRFPSPTRHVFALRCPSRQEGLGIRDPHTLLPGGLLGQQHRSPLLSPTAPHLTRTWWPPKCPVFSTPSTTTPRGTQAARFPLCDAHTLDTLTQQPTQGDQISTSTRSQLREPRKWEDPPRFSSFFGTLTSSERLCCTTHLRIQFLARWPTSSTKRPKKQASALRGESRYPPASPRHRLAPSMREPRPHRRCVDPSTSVGLCPLLMSTPGVQHPWPEDDDGEPGRVRDTEEDVPRQQVPSERQQFHLGGFRRPRRSVGTQPAISSPVSPSVSASPPTALEATSISTLRVPFHDVSANWPTFPSTAVSSKTAVGSLRRVLAHPAL